MGSAATVLAARAGEPAVGLVSSLLIAAIGLAIVVIVAAKVLGDSNGGEADDADPDAEHTTDDVV